MDAASQGKGILVSSHTSHWSIVQQMNLSNNYVPKATFNQNCPKICKIYLYEYKFKCLVVAILI